MPYPETAEGFVINDQKKWTEFSKQEVRTYLPASLKFSDC